MDPPKLKIRNETSQTRKQIFEWLKTLPPARIKDIFTIRQQKNVKLLQQMLSKRTQNNQVLTTSEIKDGCQADLLSSQIYLQGTWQLKQIEKYPCGVNSKNSLLEPQQDQSRTVEFHHPDQLLKIIGGMHGLAQQLPTSLFHLARVHIILNEERTDSLWFPQGEFHSFAQWIVFMFEWEIKKAYLQERKVPKAQLNDRKKSFYEYVKEGYTRQAIEEYLEKVIKKYFIKEDDKKQSQENKKYYLLTKSKQRLRDQPDFHQFVIEYHWFYDHHTSDTFQVFQKLAQVLYEQYQKWVEEKPLRDWQQKQKDDKQKKLQKLKKRKANRKNKDDKKEESDENQNIKKQEKVEAKQMLIAEEQDKEIKIQMQNDKNKSGLKQEQQRGVEISHIQQVRQLKKGIEKKRVQNDIMVVEQREKGKKQNEIKPKSAANKKIIKERISEYYQLFAKDLIESSNVYDRYRKTVEEIMQDFIKNQVFQNKDEDTQWSLQLYGSASAGFCLRHSDIDLVLLVNNQMSLQYIFHILKQQSWAVGCKLIQAQIPIITLQVNLQFSEVAVKTLSSKHLKKVETELFSVDLTLSCLGEPHSGIQNTKQLIEIIQAHPHIRSICILLKQFFRVRNFNKPYTGGIGSYVLIILIYSILTRKGIIELKKDAKNADNYKMVKEICEYMQNFTPFQTVISWSKNITIKADNSLDLNIVNPKNGNLLKTSAFNISKIIHQLRHLRNFQQQIEEVMLGININEKKNMKNLFFKAFNNFLYHGSSMQKIIDKQNSLETL